MKSISSFLSAAQSDGTSEEASIEWLHVYIPVYNKCFNFMNTIIALKYHGTAVHIDFTVPQYLVPIYTKYTFTEALYGIINI